jgi:cobalamin biosynthesis Mg chelatase CobN
LKRLAPVFLVALVLIGSAAAAPPKNSHSTVACRNRIINQWEGTGKIATTYAPACYRAALKFLSGQTDLQTYSSLGDDIRLALQAALARQHGKKVPLKVGKHYGKAVTPVGFTTPGGSSGSSASSGGSKGSSGSTGTGPHKGPAKGPSGAGEAASSTSSSSGLPLPVIILGGIALALVATGAIGTGVRFARRRGPNP